MAEELHCYFSAYIFTLLNVAPSPWHLSLPNFSNRSI